MQEFPTDGNIADIADIADIARRGISRSEIERQLAALRNPPAKIELSRPCRLGRGIHVLAPAEWPSLEREWEEAAGSGRLMKFVPASGAASRMFSFLRSFLETGTGRESPDTARFLNNLDRLPFPAHPTDLAELARRPKGLLPFHDYGSQHRTALAEHLFEATTHLAPRDLLQRLHFTVSPEHLEQFEVAAEALRGTLASEGWSIQVDFSTQDPSTDTLAATLQGEPARTSDGRLLFRPAGHGALIANLERAGGDLVFIKNIDNISRSERHAENGRWKKRLAGHLVRTQRLVWALLEDLDSEQGSKDAIERGVEELRRFGLSAIGWSASAPNDESAAVDTEARRRSLIAFLDRPLRVSGVVENKGEPGGGPFWVLGSNGVESPQIVETAQIETENPRQDSILNSATHFNPVDLVCAVRDRRGRPYSLERFVDPATSMVSVKRDGERRVKVLERPGLWNGAMAGWNTVFVEVPNETFTPVKTALDLLRPEHQPS